MVFGYFFYIKLSFNFFLYCNVKYVNIYCNFISFRVIVLKKNF